MKEYIVETKNLKKYYQMGDNTVKALDGIDFRVKDREFVAIIGKSGSGKSTLLHMLGGLDSPTEGEVIIEGKGILGLKKEQLAILRRRKIGFIFQNYNLVSDLNVYENVILPVELDGRKVDVEYVDTILETVVLLSHKKPDGHINVKVEFGEGEGKVPLDNIAKRAEEYKPKERVTYKMIKEYIEAKYGFKVHTAYIAEVKRDLGLPMYDAPNAVEELKQPRKHPTAEKVEAIKDALKHFEVI